MQPGRCDALVIGGGPGGSAAATFLARAGKRVLVLEKAHFPRFHIGESLPPYNRRLVGPRLVRVGDAAGFMDPIFSAGVYLAMYSGKLASQVVLDSLAAGDEGGRRLRAYEKRVFRAMRLYWGMVEQFYTTPFMELFLEPREKFNLPDAMVAFLAGEVEGGWRLDWRRRLFFWLVRIQAIRPLVPQVTFE